MHEKSIDTYSQEWKFQCGVKQLCKWRAEWGLQKFRDYLSEHKIDKKLLDAFADQWQKGNKGDSWI